MLTDASSRCRRRSVASACAPLIIAAALALPRTAEAGGDDGWSACGGDHVNAELRLETNAREILDVQLEGAEHDPQLRACMEQVAWSIEPFMGFERFESWTFDL